MNCLIIIHETIKKIINSSRKSHLLVKCANTTDRYLSTATATVEKVEPAREIFEKIKVKLRHMTVSKNYTTTNFTKGTQFI